MGDGSEEIAEGHPRIFELYSQASRSFERVNSQPDALHQEGGYVRVFVTFGKFYTEIDAMYMEASRKWVPQKFKPWLHIFEAQAGGRHRPLFHVLAEEVARYWYTSK